MAGVIPKLEKLTVGKLGVIIVADDLGVVPIEKRNGFYYAGMCDKSHFKFTVFNDNIEHAEVTVKLSGQVIKRLWIAAFGNATLGEMPDGSRFLLTTESSNRAMSEGAVPGSPTNGVLELSYVTKRRVISPRRYPPPYATPSYRSFAESGGYPSYGGYAATPSYGGYAATLSYGGYPSFGGYGTPSAAPSYGGYSSDYPLAGAAAPTALYRSSAAAAPSYSPAPSPFAAAAPSYSPYPAAASSYSPYPAAAPSYSPSAAARSLSPRSSRPAQENKVGYVVSSDLKSDVKWEERAELTPEQIDTDLNAEIMISLYVKPSCPPKRYPPPITEYLA